MPEEILHDTSSTPHHTPVPSSTRTTVPNTYSRRFATTRKDGSRAFITLQVDSSIGSMVCRMRYEEGSVDLWMVMRDVKMSRKLYMVVSCLTVDD
jgi:hypothetical protein